MAPVRFATGYDTAIKVFYFVTLLIPLVLVAAAWIVWPGSSAVVVSVPLAIVVLIRTLQWYITHYTITETDLVIRSGVYRARIPLSAIAEVRYDNGLMLNVYGFSSKQLVIVHGRSVRWRTRISPVDRASFVATLRARCPQLVVTGEPA